MKRFLFSKLLFCVIFYNYLFLYNCEDITIWDNQDISQSRSSLTIRMMQNSEVDRGLLRSILDALKGQKFLPKCAMVGCATNATQCVAHGGTEMTNKMSVEDYTQAYFKSVFTMDKTFLSINCKKILVPCCFKRTVIDPKPTPKPSFFQSLQNKIPSIPSMPSMPSMPTMPSLPSIPTKPNFIRVLNSMMSDMPPMSIYVLSNICIGFGGGMGSISCNNDD